MRPVSPVTTPTDHPIGVRELQVAYETERLRPQRIVDLVLQRIEARGQDAVWISRWPDRELRQRAADLDRIRRDQGTARMPLFGVPCAVKDNIDVAGLPTTAACPAFSYRPAHNARCVQRLIDAGAIVIGKTNMDQFATGLTGTRSPYGTCPSVLGGGLISGGSSSGSAVAVAAGLVCFALGTDTAGSGRVPAAMNGIVGCKPTRGLVSTAGVVPACRSLDCVSIFTADVEDAATVLDVVTGFDPTNPWSRPVSGNASYSADRHSRVGILIPTGAELEGFLAEHPDDVAPITRQVIEGGGRFDAVATFRAWHRLKELQRWTEQLWQRAQLLIMPTVPTTYTMDEIAQDPVRRNAVLGRYTQFVNLLDLAALTVPAGRTVDGRPASITLIGPAFSEPLLLSVGTRLTTCWSTT